MQDALRLLAELNDSDIDWILEQGTEQQVIANTLIIREGQHPDAIFIVLDGLLGVEIDAASNQLIAKLGPGELLGEMSFLEGRPASATVKAVENSLILSLSRQTLEAKLGDDPAFAARFYRACAIVTSRRLRETVGSIALQDQDKAVQTGLLADVWSRLSQPLDAMKKMLALADQEAIRNQNQVPEKLAAEIESAFHQFMAYINEQIGDSSGLSDHVRQEVGAQLQREILPYLHLTNAAERCYAKPRGYAGDFLSIEIMYNNTPQGVGRMGALLDGCFLNTPASKAVRNRRGLLTEHIQTALSNAEGKTARITSMACGPATEIFDVFKAMEDRSKMHATLIDIDLQALAFVSDKCDQLNLRRHIDLVNGNLVYLATGRQKLKLSNQDLVYSIGLIDYFSDKFVIALLNYAHSLLQPGGKVVLGNFHPKNTSKAMMDYLIDWKLIHRSEEDMNRLFKASAFGQPCTDIRFEAEGINLFAEGVKQG